MQSSPGLWRLGELRCGRLGVEDFRCRVWKGCNAGCVNIHLGEDIDPRKCLGERRLRYLLCSLHGLRRYKTSINDFVSEQKCQYIEITEFTNILSHYRMDKYLGCLILHLY